MKEIPLTKGKIALVDDEDFERLAQNKWYAKLKHGIWYAYRLHSIAMHQEVLGAKYIDHRDGDGLNNQKFNLRKSTSSQNQQNRKGNRHRRFSRFKGVIRWSKSKPWGMCIRVNGVKRVLGGFYTEEAAAIAYNLAAQRHFGEFARLNVVQGVCDENETKQAKGYTPAGATYPIPTEAFTEHCPDCASSS